MIHNNEPKVELHIKIPFPLDQKIVTYCNNLHKNSKVEAIRELLEFALSMVENMSKLRKDPTLVERLHEQFQEGDLVDSIQTMSPRDFQVMLKIFEIEKMARYGSKSKSSVESYISAKLEKSDS